MTLAPESIVRAFSGALFIVLGLWVARVRPRSRATTALATFAALYGFGFLAVNLLADASSPDPWYFSALPEDGPVIVAAFVLTILTDAVAYGALVVLVSVSPRPLRGRDRRHVALPVIVAGAALLVLEAVAFSRDLPADLSAEGPPAVLLLDFLKFPALGVVFECAMLFVLVLLAQRFRGAGGRDAEREQRQLALMGGALVLYPAIEMGDDVAHASGGMGGADAFWIAARILPYVLVALLWLRNARGAAPAPRRAARNVALVTLAMLLVGMTETALGTPGYEKGIARILMVAVLAYAILRHRLLGLDVKVKWTLRQSTIGAMFLAVFFVVSEMTALFLEGRIGAFVGILAAGTLLFALHPVQRLAERLADRAMPDAKAPAEMSPDERHTIFREMALAAWADGALTREERRLLAQLRAKLGLSAEDAERIEREAADDGA